MDRDLILTKVNTIRQILKSSPKDISYKDKELIEESCNDIEHLTNEDAYIGEKTQIIREYTEKLYMERDYEKKTGDFMNKDLRYHIDVACSNIETKLSNYK